MTVWTCALATLALTLAACGDNRVEPGEPDGSAVDASSFDADLPKPIDADLRDAAPAADAIPALTCAAPITLQPGTSHLGNTNSHINQSFATCSSGTKTANDAVYRVPLPAEPTDLIARVLVDEAELQPYDPVLSILTTCGDQETEVACADFGFSEAAEALSLTNEAFIHVDGTAQFGGSPAGYYQLDVRTRSIATLAAACDPAALLSRCTSGARCVASTCVTDSTALACSEAANLTPGVLIQDQTHAFEPDFFQGSCAFDTASGAPERLFSISLAQDSDLVVTTDILGTSYDTVLYLLDACQGAELACADDIDPTAGNFSSRLSITALAAGDYLLVVDGASLAAPTGDLSIRLEVTPL